MTNDDDFFELPKGRPPPRKAPEVEAPAPSAPAERPVASALAETAAPQVAPASGLSAPPPPLPPNLPPPGASRKPPRLWLWPVFGVGVVGVIIIGGLLGYWVFMNVAARLLISDQPLTIQLPPHADVTMQTDHKIDVLMKGTIYAQVPLVQTLDLPVKGTYDTIVNIDTKVPLETVITYEGIIPVDSIAEIEAKAPVNFQNVKKYKNLHFKAKLPLKLRLPVKLVVPVKQDIPLKYHGPLRVAIDHVIRAPVNTTLKTALKVDQEFNIPITTSVPLRLDLPQHPVRATIVESDLNLDLSTLRLERKPGAGATR
ncbi:hypothetical protein DFR24_2834 [Panacagrimonas perspica]|uniref:Uncharacterized protein n=1 Tax=Panacagrimonas perspica TaxID=381431 RepID=A0A4R7P4T0_9GAMM|nr:hypothetical protein [Panacagrimonas perspica]TDU28462.1 hypothetical protein DFR24_2834 [Panacagrimonas perspica]